MHAFSISHLNKKKILKRENPTRTSRKFSKGIRPMGKQLIVSRQSDPNHLLKAYLPLAPTGAAIGLYPPPIYADTFIVLYLYIRKI